MCDMTKLGRRIAIVDDDPSVRKALVRLFETTDYAATAYASAAEFLQALQSEPPDCLIADFQMPEMTGLELQSHLVLNGIDIPTIMVTAHDEPGVRESCIRAGSSAFLVKPVRKSMLLLTIDDAVRSRCVRQRLARKLP
jgi:FixJ family two-component response regulator